MVIGPERTGKEKYRQNNKKDSIEALAKLQKKVSPPSKAGVHKYLKRLDSKLPRE
jgi:DNA-binding transcriptional regulator WhiA